MTVDRYISVEAWTHVTDRPRVKTTADVLRHAAWIIEERGWTQGGFHHEGRLCVMGAINTAYTGHHESWGDVDSLGIKACRALSGFVGAFSSSSWNDTPGRTVAEVTTALRAAADASERAS